MTDFTLKEQNFINAYTTAVTNILNANISLTNIVSQWNAMAYATGASPSGNNITDATAASVRPSLNALILNQAMGAIASVQATIAANLGYLEAIRP